MNRTTIALFMALMFMLVTVACATPDSSASAPAPTIVVVKGGNESAAKIPITVIPPKAAAPVEQAVPAELPKLRSLKPRLYWEDLVEMAKIFEWNGVTWKPGVAGYDINNAMFPQAIRALPKARMADITEIRLSLSRAELMEMVQALTVENGLIGDAANPEMAKRWFASHGVEVVDARYPSSNITRLRTQDFELIAQQSKVSLCPPAIPDQCDLSWVKPEVLARVRAILRNPGAFVAPPPITVVPPPTVAPVPTPQVMKSTKPVVLAGQSSSVVEIPYQTYGFPNQPGAKPAVVASTKNGVPVIFYKTPVQVWSAELLKTGGLELPELSLAQKVEASVMRYGGTTVKWAAGAGIVWIIADETYSAIGANTAIVLDRNLSQYIPISPTNPQRDRISEQLTALGLLNTPLYSRIEGRRTDAVRDSVRMQNGGCNFLLAPSGASMSDDPVSRVSLTLMPFLKQKIPTGILVCPGSVVGGIQGFVYVSTTTGETVEFKWNLQKSGGQGWDKVGPTCLSTRMGLPTSKGTVYSAKFRLCWEETGYAQILKEVLYPEFVDQ